MKTNDLIPRKFLVLNKNDRSLKPFRIMLPKPPSKAHIKGHEKKIENQVFEHTLYPQRLKDLE